MPDPPVPSTAYWTQKLILIIAPILEHLAQKRTGHGNTKLILDYRGLEHHWYGPWICALVLLCEADPTMIPCPQRWVSSSVFNDEDEEIKRWLISDFTILRVKKNPRQPAEGPPRRSARLQCHPPAQEQVQDDNARPAPRRLLRVLQKVAALVEVKCPPIGDTHERIIIALQEARLTLAEQAKILFSKKNQLRKKKRMVIGIFAAGNFWSWQRLTPDNIGVKPLSTNQDPTWGPDVPQIPEIPEWDYYELGTPESDIAMREVRDAMRMLPGSTVFNSQR